MRQRDGGLRALPQRLPAPRRARLHRGVRAGQVGTFSCPYHAWTYELDGQAGRRRPTSPRCPTSTVPSAGWSAVAVREWLGYVWVCLADEPRRHSRIGVIGRGLRPSRRRSRRSTRYRHRVARGRAPHRLRRGRQLEAHRRELHGVLPLRYHPSRAGQRAARVRRRLRGPVLRGARRGLRRPGAKGSRSTALRGFGRRSRASPTTRTGSYYAITIRPAGLHQPGARPRDRAPDVPARRRTGRRWSCDWLFSPDVIASGSDVSLVGRAVRPGQPAGLRRLRADASPSMSLARLPRRRASSSPASTTSPTSTPGSAPVSPSASRIAQVSVRQGRYGVRVDLSKSPMSSRTSPPAVTRGVEGQ